MHIVLYEPDIPWNTGNVGRTCVATGTSLHLVGRLGFSLEASQVRRSGLDYWTKVQLSVHADWESFLQTLPETADLFFFSKKASVSLWDAEFSDDSYLVFGCETKGLPDVLMKRYADRLLRIPMREDSVRSLNLSTAVGVVLFEALRQVRRQSNLLTEVTL